MYLQNIYNYIFIFLLFGFGFVLAPFAIAYLIAPKKPTEKKLSTYECGEPPFGFAWVQYNVRYYIFALIFLVFDVETIFLYPWAVVIREIGAAAVIEMFIFLLILILGLIYAWRKGALEWF